MTFEEYLKEVLSYNKETGEFFWIKPGRSRVLSKPAGGKNAQGYIQIEARFEGKRKVVYGHRAAFLLTEGSWPSGVVDHANGDRSDNRIENLRKCEQVDNCANQFMHRNNTSGYKGVTKLKDGLYAAYYGKNGYRHLGRFGCPIAAAKAYDEAAIRVYGEFAKTNASMGLL